MLVKKIKLLNDKGRFAQGSKDSISKFKRPHKLAEKLSC